MTIPYEPYTAIAARGFGQRAPAASAVVGDPTQGVTFDTIYEATIEPHLVALQREHARAVTVLITALTIGVSLSVLEAVSFFDLGKGVGVLVIPTMTTAMLLGAIPLWIVFRKARAAVMTPICARLGLTFRAGRGEFPEARTFHDLHLLPDATRQSYQDFAEGRHNGVALSFCQTWQGYGSRGSIVFEGQLIRLQAPWQRSSTTVVLRNAEAIDVSPPQGLRPVGLEDPSFNQTFTVYSSDQVESREILTPTVMERLDALNAALSGRWLSCAFMEGQVLIAVHGGYVFQGSEAIFQPEKRRAGVLAMTSGLEQVFSLIDAFQDA